MERMAVDRLVVVRVRSRFAICLGTVTARGSNLPPSDAFGSRYGSSGGPRWTRTTYLRGNGA
jgi:hypothetical protein